MTKKKQEYSKLAKFLERKISTKKVEASGVAALTFGDLIYDMVRVDQRYIDGVDFSRPSKNLSSVFKIGKQNISELTLVDMGGSKFAKELEKTLIDKKGLGN